MIKFQDIVEELGHNIAFVLDRENVRYTSEDSDPGTLNLSIYHLRNILLDVSELGLYIADFGFKLIK